MDVDAPASTATYLAWLLRILLPILLFTVWYRSQAPVGSGGKCCYAKDVILAARGAAESPASELPDCLRGLRLVDDATAQRLLGGPPPRVGGSGAGGGRREARGQRQKPGIDRACPNIDGRRNEQGQLPADAGDAPDPAEAPDAGPATQVQQPLLSPDERARHQQLLNFVAYSHKGRPQRSFLHDDDHPPPPPPRPPVRRSGSGDEIGGPAAQKANLEVQGMLTALLNAKVGMKSTDAPKLLYQHLLDAQVAVDAATFTLLVEASAHANDLQTASDFLMKMEAAGHCAGADLLDRVMDLYTDSGATRQPSGGGSTGEEAGGGRKF